VSEYWQAIVVADVAQVIAGLERTRAFAAGTSAKGKKNLRPKSMPTIQNTAAFQADTAANASDECRLAHVQLAALSHATQFVMLRYRDQDYTFNRAQVLRLQHYLQARAQSRVSAAQELRDLAVLGGVGSLDDLLALRVRVTEGLPVITGRWGEVVALQTLQFQGYLSCPKTVTIGELAGSLAARLDFDGIACNAPYLGEPAIHFGPNFSTDCLSGVDPRLAKSCPAAAVQDFSFGLYLSRFFADLKEPARATISKQLNQARGLLDAFPPAAQRLPRSAVHSIMGARAMRKYPQFFERSALAAFIARLERALKTRWRVGIY
jgi:hypothetical protein